MAFRAGLVTDTGSMPVTTDLHRLRSGPCRAALVLATLATPAAAADMPPAVVASFTRQVQPLVLNRCASGACHGGPDSPAPRFSRAAGMQPDRRRTHANLAAFLEAVGPERDPTPLARLLAADHPTAGGRGRRRATALTAPERLTIEHWLADVRAAEQPATTTEPGVVPAAAETPEPAPNRFRRLLDTAANPPVLPPPEEPRGVIFKNEAPPGD